MLNEAVVNEGVIQHLLANQQACASFPFLAHFAKMAAPQANSCCGRRARMGLNYRAIKMSLFGMSETEIGRLKGFLGAEKLVFFFPGPKGTERLVR